ncbi:6-phosphofructo-2-kinase/fructose-2,6-bisphosphatase-like protein [Trifolium pratense]|uniref:6-phosphofructo-2-kinase/fructose-2, 6-bisphosphatase-like protein n=1 Tax=Trifolium pratense TaxID=57577 RepID=A0A2K3JL51_TRIPR|nr:6-phosphofructo-2-kinase/fructose-2,6-bisphosphatase-like protein [Trifolium pratense]
MVTGNNEELDGNGIHQTPLRIPELLYVSVKMENPILALAGNLFPHVFFSSAALLGDSCDSFDGKGIGVNVGVELCCSSKSW